MNDLQKAYAEGFMTKCAARGVDPEALLKSAAPVKLVDGKVDPDTMNFDPKYRGQPVIPAPKPVIPAPKPVIPAPKPAIDPGVEALMAEQGARFAAEARAARATALARSQTQARAAAAALKAPAPVKK